MTRDQVLDAMMAAQDPVTPAFKTRDEADQWLATNYPNLKAVSFTRAKEEKDERPVQGL